ncbi:MAG: hypothetical protein U0136_14385 [Bdellovibrionota bacterium]
MNVFLRSVPFSGARFSGAHAISVLFVLMLAFAPSAHAQPAEEPSNGSRYSLEQFSKALLIQPIVSEGTGSAHVASASLSGSLEERHDIVPTGLGAVSLRWPARLRPQVAFVPSKTIQSSWSAAESALRDLGFPAQVVASDYDWNVVVSGDGAALEPGVSRVSSAYCHTALMGPPADIVIDGYRLLHPCAVGISPEQALQISLVHEVGHAVEFRLLGAGFSRRQRWHGEGFATWFESRARERLPFKAMTSDDRARLRERARTALTAGWRPYLFQGSPEDYARSYGLIATIAEAHSVPALIQVYQRMSADNCLFEEAVQRELGLSFDQWLTEARDYLASR